MLYSSCASWLIVISASGPLTHVSFGNVSLVWGLGTDWCPCWAFTTGTVSSAASTLSAGMYPCELYNEGCKCQLTLHS